MNKLEQLAYNFANKYHDGYFRKDGITPYIVHPIEVVDILKSWGVDNSEAIAAAYLHDLLEDTEVTENELAKVFNRGVINKVKKLTHDKNISKDKYLKNIAKDSDIFVLLIKFADRIANTIDFIADNKGSYAKDYFHKADIIYNVLKSNKKILGTIFLRVESDKKQIENILKKY